MPAKFNTITGSDWRVSLIAARDRRTLNQIKIRNQIRKAHENNQNQINLSHAERENARLQMELDASCNAEELRQVRAENARLREAIKWAEPYVPKYSETYRMISELPNV